MTRCCELDCSGRTCGVYSGKGLHAGVVSWIAQVEHVGSTLAKASTPIAEAYWFWGCEFEVDCQVAPCWSTLRLFWQRPSRHLQKKYRAVLSQLREKMDCWSCCWLLVDVVRWLENEGGRSQRFILCFWVGNKRLDHLFSRIDVFPLRWLERYSSQCLWIGGIHTWIIFHFIYASLKMSEAASDYAGWCRLFFFSFLWALWRLEVFSSDGQANQNDFA